MAFELHQNRTLSLHSYDKNYNLVRMAFLVVAAGILVVVVKQAYTAITNLENDQFGADISQVENWVFSYQERFGRWPGDCNRDGVIANHPARLPQPTNVVAVDEIGLKSGCDVLGRQAEGYSVVLSDLHKSSFVSEQDVEMLAGDAYQIGSGILHLGQTEFGANVIVAYNVPVSVARWFDARVDGEANGEQGRVRRWDHADHGGQWSQQGGKVSLAYYFAKITP